MKVLDEQTKYKFVPRVDSKARGGIIPSAMKPNRAARTGLSISLWYSIGKSCASHHSTRILLPAQ
jgi:hypothetical protein